MRPSASRLDWEEQLRRQSRCALVRRTRLRWIGRCRGLDDLTWRFGRFNDRRRQRTDMRSEVGTDALDHADRSLRLEIVRSDGQKVGPSRRRANCRLACEGGEIGAELGQRRNAEVDRPLRPDRALGRRNRPRELLQYRALPRRWNRARDRRQIERGWHDSLGAQLHRSVPSIDDAARTLASSSAI